MPQLRPQSVWPAYIKPHRPALVSTSLPSFSCLFLLFFTLLFFAMAQAQADLILGTGYLAQMLGTVAKRWAERGKIGVHTFAVLPLLGRMCPLCPKYRDQVDAAKAKNSNPIRLKNHVQKAVLEIGLNQNPLEDDLKQSNDGINVLGLFSALIPFLDDSQFTDLLLGIYGHSKQTDVGTPGPSQIRLLRSQLDPFMSALKFPEKMEEWACLLYNQANPKDSTTVQRHKVLSNPFSGSFPDQKSLPALLDNIQLLAQEEDSKAVIKVYGPQGAAWVATYCHDMLALGICVLSKSEDDRTGSARTVTLPLGCDSYSNAKVHFYVNSTEAAFSVHHTGIVEDFIHEPKAPLTPESHPEQLISRPASANQRTRFVYDCDDTDFLQHHFPDIHCRPELEPISHFAAAHTMRTIADYAGNLEAPGTEDIPNGFTTYFQDALPDIQARGLAILRALGFQPARRGFYEERICHTFPNQSSGLLNVREDVNSPRKGRYSSDLNIKEQYMAPLFWGEQGSSSEASALQVVHERLQKLRKDDKQSTDSVPPTSTSDGPQRRLFRIALYRACGLDGLPSSDEWDNSLFYVLQNAIRIASVLSFTNWIEAQHLRKLSSDYFQPFGQDPWFLSSAKCLSNTDPYVGQEPLINEAIRMITNLSRFEIMAHPKWSEGWIGLQLRGTVVLRQLACPPTSQPLKGCLMSLHLGHITVEGGAGVNSFREAPHLNTEPWPGSIDNVQHSITDAISISAIQPSDEFAKHAVHTNVAVHGDVAFVRCEFFAFQCAIVPLSPTLITKSIYASLISAPCEHPTSSALDENYVFRQEPWNTFSLHNGFFFHQAGEFPFAKLSIMVQQANQNTLGQWAACHIDSNDDHPATLIIQRQSCLNCVLRSAEGLLPSKAEPGESFPGAWSVFIVSDVEKVQNPPRAIMEPHEAVLRKYMREVEEDKISIEDAKRELKRLGVPLPLETDAERD